MHEMQRILKTGKKPQTQNKQKTPQKMNTKHCSFCLGNHSWNQLQKFIERITQALAQSARIRKFS